MDQLIRYVRLLRLMKFMNFATLMMKYNMISIDNALLMQILFC